ncbi:MAG: PAS domain S-box protein [Flavipsychrobacter sp.]|nr:PAS domain S-box protein [Flavipsychrobacter sp.]
MPNTRKKKILIVDDDEDDFIITSGYIRHIPGGNFEIEWCPKYKDALQKMAAHEFDLYFVDYRLGARSGVELLKEALDAGCEEPIILLTGKGNYEVDIEAMQIGAVDYLIKSDLTIEKMERCIRYALERFATLKALRANERKYRSIFEKSKDLVFLTDESLDFKDVNDAGFLLLGYTKAELLQMNLCDLVEQEAHREFIFQSLAYKKEVNDREVVLVSKDGERKSCMITAKQEDDPSGFSFVQGIVHDITNLRRMEKATLQGEKLAATGRLVRTLAHEVRNPLNNITLSVEQMQHDVQDEGIKVYMDIIQRNSKRISDLISQLLHTSRPSEITLEQRFIQSILDEVIDASIDRITLKKIKLKVNYPDEAVMIDADDEKLKLALLNIVINAIEAMEEGRGELEISVYREAEQVMLVIEDNGCGISEENISRLFEPYFTQKRNGMGLGLAFTLNILQSHKAGIEVSSKEGEGTRFMVGFPAVTVTGGTGISSVEAE